MSDQQLGGDAAKTIPERDLRWLNPPPSCRIEREGAATEHIEIVTGANTDFWRNTFYGFQHDTGHFLHRSVAGDFSAEVHVTGAFGTLYDQAGLMARLSDAHWVKCGVEFSDGLVTISVVVTNGNSDWSLLDCPEVSGSVFLRLTRHGEALRVQYFSSARQVWKMVRLAYLPPALSLDVGVMACSPLRCGFKAVFSGFQITDPIARDLHV